MPLTQALFCGPPIERGTKSHGTQSTFLRRLVDHRDLAFAAVSCPSLVLHLQFLFSVLLLVIPPRYRQPRGAFRCNIDAAKFVAELAVQIFWVLFLRLGGRPKTLLSLRHGQGKHLNISGFLSSNGIVDTLKVVPSPQ